MFHNWKIDNTIKSLFYVIYAITQYLIQYCIKIFISKKMTTNSPHSYSNCFESISNNPLLASWDTPYQTPPFSSIRNEHYIPAMQVAITEAEHNAEAIALLTDTPTFDNTIVALERATERVDRIGALLFNLNECNTDNELQRIASEMAPALSRLSNRIYMDKRIYARVADIYERRNELSLTEEQLTLIEETRQHFLYHGVALSDQACKRFESITARLAEIEQLFSCHILADTNDYTLHITDKMLLDGLPDHAIEAAHIEAEQRGLDGWVFTLAYPSYNPFITYCQKRELREQIWRAYNSRGNHGNKNDNNAIILEITALRNEMAQLLGYETYCHYVLSRRMAGSIERVTKFMQNLRDAALPIAQQDCKEVAQYATEHGGPTPLQPWDYAYYSEQLKRERYQFDFEKLRPYFPLEQVRQGIFDLYGSLYGLQFIPNAEIETYHPECIAYEVREASRHIGILYMDMHPRSNKRNGAWMTEFRNQSRLDGIEVRPLIQIVCNFSRPAAERPALLSYDEVKTFMHEFGHAIHGLLSDVTYPSLSGTHVKRDFVEVPSQLMENWCRQRSFLNTFARHYKTGTPLPDDYIEHIQLSEHYQAGYRCVRQLNFGTIDLAFHSITEPLRGDSVEEFENRHLIQLLPSIKGCIFSTSFSHIFAGGYASGYYGYKWAEVLDADLFERFKEEGIFNKEIATKWRKQILSRGGTQQPADLFRNFMGREPRMTAFLKRSFGQ